MRRAFVNALCDLADSDERVMLLTADLGFQVIESFADRFPGRFLNLGVAEANMIGVATGLAERGFLPFCYSIATFVSMRGYEQLRNGPAIHNLPVRIIGIGAGFAYGPAGRTHHALEDIALARLQPELTIVGPADDDQAVAALRQTYSRPGPIYYRLRKDSGRLPAIDGAFAVGELQSVGGGTDLLLVCTGSMATISLEVTRDLEELGVRTTLAILSCIRPAPEEQLLTLMRRSTCMMTVEDHYLVGGIGSLVADLVLDKGLVIPAKRCGVYPALDGRSGSEQYMLAQHGLCRDDLVRDAVVLVKSTRARPSVRR